MPQIPPNILRPEDYYPPEMQALVAQHEAAFLTARREGRVVKAEDSPALFQEVAASFLRSHRSKLALAIGGLPGGGKGHFESQSVKIIRGNGLGVAELPTDWLMRTKRGSRARIDRLKSPKALIDHFCDVSAFRGIATSVLRADGTPIDVPLGRHYKNGDFINDDHSIHVRSDDDVGTVFLSEGVVAPSNLAPLARMNGIPHTEIVVHCDPLITPEVGVMRDVKDHRIGDSLEEIRARWLERLREVFLLLPHLTHDLKSAPYVIENGKVFRDAGEQWLSFLQKHQK